MTPTDLILQMADSTDPNQDFDSLDKFVAGFSAQIAQFPVPDHEKENVRRLAASCGQLFQEAVEHLRAGRQEQAREWARQGEVLVNEILARA